MRGEDVRAYEAATAGNGSERGSAPPPTELQKLGNHVVDVALVVSRLIADEKRRERPRNGLLAGILGTLLGIFFVLLYLAAVGHDVVLRLAAVIERLPS